MFFLKEVLLGRMKTKYKTWMDAGRNVEDRAGPNDGGLIILWRDQWSQFEYQLRIDDQRKYIWILDLS